MKKPATYLIETLKKMPRPPTYLDEMRTCAESFDEKSITVDDASECMQALRDKYRALRLEGHYPRVLQTYAQPLPISIPSYWSEIKATLATPLSYDFVESINLTGSALYQKPTHDLDLSIRINNWAKYQDNYAAFRASLPSRIMDLRTDYFTHTLKYGLWAELDCERKILYAPAAFNMRGRPIQSGIRINRIDDRAELREAKRIRDSFAKPNVLKTSNLIRATEPAKRRGCGCSRHG